MEIANGEPAYTANLTINKSIIAVEILNSPTSNPMQEFNETKEGLEDVIAFLRCEKVIGVRLSGKQMTCSLLAEKLLKRGIRPIISDFNQIKKNNKHLEGIRGIPVINPNVAGIDIGQSLIYVSIPQDLEEDSTRVFGTFTSDLEGIVVWLKYHKINTVAMEATGVYWNPLYDLCERNGIKALVVNPKHVKMLPGRKSDVLDSQWLMRLLACGLLNGGFIPPQPFRAMRDLARHRQDLMDRGGDSLNRVVKMLELMNIKLASVISDVSGKSGMAIIKAIIEGERDPHKLVQLVDERCKSSKEDIAKALVGTYSEEYVHIMNAEMEIFEYLHNKAIENELKIQELLQKLPDQPELKPLPKKQKTEKTKKDYNRSPYCFDLRTLLYKKFGCDLTAINGIAPPSAAIILFEIGGKVDAFPTAKHFASWNGTAPGTKISGGKKLSGKAPKKFSRVGQALRIAANSNAKSDNSNGAYLRAQVRRGKSKLSARKSTAHRMGDQVYSMLKYGQEYVEKSAEAFEKVNQERQVHAIKRRLKAMGFDVHLVDIKTGALAQ